MNKRMTSAMAANGSDQTIVSHEGIVLRRDLSKALSTSVTTHPLTLIVAPPVSGKTTLVRQTFADPEGDRKIIYRGASAPDLCSELPAATAEHLFVIRGFDRLDLTAQFQLGEKIEERLGNGPSFLLIADRPLQYAFAAPRIRGHVKEFGIADLAFNAAEAKALLKASDPHAAEKNIHVLLEKTWGWPGAWAIIQTLIKGGTEIKELVRNFSGADLELARYFDQIIMPSLSPDLQQFLSKIGIHQSVTPEFVDYLTGETGGWKMLEDACQHCLFMTWDSRSRSAASAHPLFRDYLDSSAARGTPELYRKNLERAADWSAAKSNWLAATKLYSQAGNTEKAIEILNLHSDDLITNKGEILNYRHMRSKLEPVARTSPALASDFAMSAIFSGDFAEAAALLDSLGDSIAQMQEPQRARLEAIRISIDFGFERFQQLITEAPRWLKQFAGVDARYRVIVAASLFWAYHAELNSPASYKTLSLIRQEVSKSQSSFLQAWLAIVAATFKQEHGRIHEAELVVIEDIGDGVVRHTLDLVRASIALEGGHIDRATRLIEQSLQEGTRHGVVETTLMGWQTAARLALRARGLPSAIRLLEGAEPVVAHRHGERARLLIRLTRATLILQSPEMTLPEGLLREIEAISDNVLSLGFCRSTHEIGQITLARFHARFGDARRAISLLQPIVSASLRDARWRVWTQASLIIVGSQLRLGNTEKALRQAWHIIEEISEDGIRATFTDEHVLLLPLIGDLIERLNASGIQQTDAIRSVIEGLAQRAGLPISGQQTPDHNEELARIDVHLTKMERKILTLAAQGFSNGDISVREIIKLTTVKWHMQNLFGKLQVKSRTAAIAEARRLGLLS
ncbi:MAG: LuxR C-terminal-related transcriptional regulator [Parvibaculaceae bacterium]